MAVPKKRTGKAKQATRRANWKGEVPATTTCPNWQLQLALTARKSHRLIQYALTAAIIKMILPALKIKKQKKK